MQLVRVEQQDAHLAAIPGVDDAGGVHNRETVPNGEAGAWDDETCVSVRYFDCDSRSDHGPLPRPDRQLVARSQVETSVAVVRARGKRRLGSEARDAKLTHGVATDSKSSPAMR